MCLFGFKFDLLILDCLVVELAFWLLDLFCWASTWTWCFGFWVLVQLAVFIDFRGLVFFWFWAVQVLICFGGFA